jgi:SAM-dependent methyltransferase
MRTRVTELKLLSLLEGGSRVLDVGSGRGQPTARLLREHGHTVETVDFHDNATHRGDYNLMDLGEYDAVWTAHTLEHMPNAGSFLRRLRDNARDDGWIAVTVPPRKDCIVGGHVSLWNAGLLLYNLVLAGLDCRHAKIKSYDYNVSVLVQKKTFELPPLVCDKGDLETLEEFFPVGLMDEGRRAGFKQGFKGCISERNWNENQDTC